jgi:hypothetical protein
MLKQYFNKRNIKAALFVAISAPVMALTYQGCSSGFSSTGSGNGSNNLTSVSTPSPGQTPSPSPVSASEQVYGQGGSVTGTGATACPTALGIVTQLQNVLGVSVSTGNTKLAYALVSANLPQTTDCTKSVGYDAAQLLGYAACSDLTTGNTPVAQSKYNVTLNGTLAANKTALLAAGVTMLNGYTGGVAGSSSATTGINAALTTLITPTNGTDATSKIAFMNVCLAATTAGYLINN